MKRITIMVLREKMAGEFALGVIRGFNCAVPKCIGLKCLQTR